MSKAFYLSRRMILVTFVIIISSATHGQQSFTVMSYNIHHGAGTDNEVDLARIARVITQYQPDLVALQEVDRGVQRSGNQDQLAYLEQATGMDGFFGKTIDHQGGEYGNAILSRLPVVACQNRLFPSTHGGEQRGLILAHIALPEDTVLLFATHLDHRKTDTARLAAAAIIDSTVTVFKESGIVLTGDMNDQPGSPLIQKLRSTLRWSRKVCGDTSQFTFPSLAPARTLDYIFYNQRFVCIDSRVVADSAASDHLPVVSRLVLRDQ